MSFLVFRSVVFTTNKSTNYPTIHPRMSSGLSSRASNFSTFDFQEIYYAYSEQ